MTAARVETDLDAAFERLAKAFLAEHPEVRHEWRKEKSLGSYERVDLICAPGAPNEVFASLHGHQIVVGPTSGEHEDFEDWGRRLTKAEVAQEAFERFVVILVEQGHCAEVLD